MALFLTAEQKTNRVQVGHEEDPEQNDFSKQEFAAIRLGLNAFLSDLREVSHVAEDVRNETEDAVEHSHVVDDGDVGTNASNHEQKGRAQPVGECLQPLGAAGTAGAVVAGAGIIAVQILVHLDHELARRVGDGGHGGGIRGTHGVGGQPRGAALAAAAHPGSGGL